MTTLRIWTVPAAPAAPGDGTRGASRDAVSLLSVYLLLLLLVPAGQVVGALGGAGSPAQLVGLVAVLWWAMSRLGSDRTPPPPSFVPTALGLLALAVLAAYVAAATRAVSDVELRAADRGLLSLAAWSGVLLVAAYGIPDRQRLEVLLRRVVLGGSLMAALGLLQFATHRPWTNYLRVPGLSQNQVLVSIFDRNGLTRPASTALHPIEFGVILTMMLPLALHYALHPAEGRGVLRRWSPVVLIALAIPVSVSRSAIIGSVVALGVLVPTWPKRWRRAAYLTLAVSVPAAAAVAPSLVRTLSSLFTGISGDSSAQSRTGSYALAWSFIQRRPVFGRGFGTFLPEYRILDNQYLLMTIETGILGTAMLLLLFVAAGRTCRRTRRQALETGQIAQADLQQTLLAAVSAAAISFIFFDTLSFPTATGLTFLLVGAAAASSRTLAPPSPVTS